MLLDLRAALRRLLAAPGFAAGAALLLALGIGAAVALGSVAQAVLWRPLPYAHPESLIWIWSTRVDRDRAFFSIPNFEDTRARNRTLADLVGLRPVGINLTGDVEALRVSALRVTGNAFAVLGTRAAAGRLLEPSDDEAAAPRVCVLGHALFTSRFGGDAAVVGRTLRLDDEPYVVAGILERGFTFPGAADAEVFVPAALARDARRSDRGANSLRVIARLRPGVGLGEARADLARVTAGLAAEFPVENGKHTAPRVLALADEIAGEHRAGLSLVAGAVALLLAITCLNLAALLVARGRARAREMAIRAALGASRARLLVARAGEPFLLWLAGGALGVTLAAWLVPAVVALAPAGTPRLAEATTVDAGVVAAALAVTFAVVIGAGLLPAGRGRLGGALVAAQVGTSLVLLAATFVLTGKLALLAATRAGFEPDGLVSARVSLPRARYATPEAIFAYHQRVAEALGGRAVMTTALPLTGFNARVDYTVVGLPPPSPADVPAAQYRWVSPGTLRALGIPLLRGRDLAPADDARAPRVVIIDEIMARRHFGEGDPLGKRLHIGDGPLEHEAEIVGVSAVVAQARLGEPPTATLYEPLLQVNAATAPFLAAGLTIVARDGEALRAALRRADPEVPASTVRPVAELYADALAPARFQLRLVAAFAAAAFLLAVLGVHALAAHEVQRRRRELALRRALGASDGRLIAAVVGRSARLAALGCAAAALPALAAGWAPRALAPAAVVLVAVAALASLVPARRATRVEPREALSAGS